MIFFRRLLMVAALVAVPLAALAQGGMTVDDPFARASAGAAGASAAYMTIRGAGTGDKLLSASSPAAARVELHDHIRDGDVMRMRKVDAIPIPANGAAELKPGGLHVMLMGLKAPLIPGDRIELTLNFEKAGALTITVPVREIGAGMDSGLRHGHPKKH